jgi:hypothetical protein
MRKLTMIMVLLSGIMFGCTQNERAKMLGGTAKINLEKGQKLINVTWKDTNLWYLTKPMTDNDVAEIYTFQEESSLGIVQGKVIFIESK